MKDEMVFSFVCSPHMLYQRLKITIFKINFLAFVSHVLTFVWEIETLETNHFIFHIDLFMKNPGVSLQFTILNTASTTTST